MAQDVADAIAAEAGRRRRLFEPDEHFLSPFNPLATADQRAVEALALRLIAHPVLQAGRKTAAARWRAMVGNTITAEAESRFEELIDEFVFAYALLAANGDANYPKVVSGIYGPPHRWFGREVPGARGSGGDGPDQSYSFIPIEYGPRFEIRGQRFDPQPGDTPYMQAGDACFTMTLSMLQGYDVKADADGEFVITIDPEPANGRPNHIQTEPNSRFIFIRECRNDWREVAAKHQIVRLDPPRLPPQTEEQMAKLAVHNMSEAVPIRHHDRSGAGERASQPHPNRAELPLHLHPRMPQRLARSRGETSDRAAGSAAPSASNRGADGEAGRP